MSDPRSTRPKGITHEGPGDIRRERDALDDEASGAESQRNREGVTELIQTIYEIG